MRSCIHSCIRRTPKENSFAALSGDLIEIVNVLQNKLAASGHTLKVSLPQIVVVGCQSAGKSSVLENIAAREFLPRGTGVVTRRPTVVQLQKSEDEYAVFLHKPNEKFRNFEEVRDEIEKETLRDPGPEGYSSVPISLQIFSRNVLKLTLVDLPGLIRVTVDNQSESSIEDVRNMVLQYIRQPNSLILAVSPANQDIANSDALEIAKTVDSERVRTIGVLTKLDLMDEGTNARDILENKKIPLKRGYIGILNRSQKDIDEERDFDYCLKKEKNFFESMPCYTHMADKMGTPYLKKFLNKQLYTHIKESLPALRQELFKKLSTFQKLLNDFNSQSGRISTDNYSIQFYVIKLVQKFIDILHTEVFGHSEQVKMEGLSAGSMINYKLCTNIQENLKLPQVPNETELLTIIANLHGVKNSVALPSLALDAVANQLLSQYIDPLNNLVESISSILLSNVESCSEMMDSYPKLKNELLYFVRNYIHKAVSNTKETLEKHMKAEMYFVNTYREDFDFPKIESIQKFLPMKLWDKRETSCTSASSYNVSEYNCEEAKAIEILALNDCAKENVNYLAKTIETYLTIQRKEVGDTAIKYISFFLIKTVMDFVKSDLIPIILESADKESIFEDCEKDFLKMNDVQETCEYLKDALAAVQTF